MNIFIDFHHPALYYSLHLLLEGRLGHKIYRPIGLDWIESGYWKLLDLCVNDFQRREKIEELLLENSIPDYLTKSWNKVISDKISHKELEGFLNYPFTQKAVTFEQFKKMNFDLLIATFIDHVPIFKTLSNLYNNNVPVIGQAGNNWNLNRFGDTRILGSIKPEVTDVDILFYKQEIDLNIFSPTSDRPELLLSSFVSGPDIPKADFDLVNNVSENLGYECKWFGKHSYDGFIENIHKISSIMKKSKFGVQLKSVGDGFGHSLFNWFAIGRPVIYRSSHYKNCLGEELLNHMVTGIDLDQVENNLSSIILNLSESKYDEMCTNVKQRFNQVVDYNKDAYNVKSLLEEVNEGIY